MDTAETADKKEIDFGEFDAADEAQMIVKNPQTLEPTTWVWTFYGPGHPVTVALGNRITRELLRGENAKEQARVNGKKWHAEDLGVDEILERNVARIAERVKTFTLAKIDGEMIQFSPEAVKKLLMDRKRAWLLGQVSDFLTDIESFMTRAASK